jgi:thioredoxin reductase
VTVISTTPLTSSDAERLRLLNIPVIPDEITGLVLNNDVLVAVTTASNRQIPYDAAWVAAKIKAGSFLAASLCDVDSTGLATTDHAGRTNRPGLFAIGNANDAVAHLAHACAAGTTIGPIITMYILEQILAERRSAGNAA